MVSAQISHLSMEDTKMRRLYRYLTALVAILMLAGATAARADTFPYQTLDYPNSQPTFAYGINNGGQIAGSYNGSVSFARIGTPRGYSYAGGTYTPIDYPGADLTEARGINDAGQIVGAALSDTWHSFLFSGGVYTTLDFPGARGTGANAINNAGQIVGEYATGGWHAFLFSGGGYTNIDPPWGWSYGASGINNAGQIVGQYYDYTWHGFLLSGGVYTTLDPPGSASISYMGINNAGQIAGTYSDSAGVMHGFLLSDGVYKSLEIPGALNTGVWGINDSGVFSGFYQDAAGNWHGYVSLTAPVAKAGSNQTVHHGATVTLDGSGSNDPGGNVPLTYAWRFTAKPDGSTASLDDPASATPKFVADKYNAGDWVLELVVTNSKGVKSTPATVTISTSNSAPMAAAGDDQAVTLVGSTVALNGSTSVDPDGDSLAFKWTFVSRPEDSNAAFKFDTSPTPTFTADKHGDYEVKLTVTDPWGAEGTDTMKVSFSNVPPVANAGTNQSIVIGPSVVVNGSGTDANDDSIVSYTWSLASKPSDSAATFSATRASASFTPDVPGDFVAQLIVNDGFADSLPRTVTISVAASRNWVSDQLRNVIADLGNTALLPDAAFKNKNMRNTLITKLNVIIKDVDAGKYAGALAKLQEDVMAKTDGCATSGKPDNNDWIVTCIYQSLIYPELLDLEEHLTELAN
jgi:probable HAF family extracellular repeat protein